MKSVNKEAPAQRTLAARRAEAVMSQCAVPTGSLKRSFPRAAFKAHNDIVTLRT